MAHDLDSSGSVEKLWHIIMTSHDRTKAAFAEEEWHTVRMMNLFKQMNIDVVDEVANLLYGYLKGEIGACGNDVMYTRVTQLVRRELKLC